LKAQDQLTGKYPYLSGQHTGHSPGLNSWYQRLHWLKEQDNILLLQFSRQ